MITSSELYSFKLLQRVFKEQCRVTDGEVVVVPAREVSSDSLQNPSDPDATYDGHKGQGYQVQVLETFTPSETEQPEAGVSTGDKADSDSEKAENKPALNLITHVEVEPAHVHDSGALKPALEDVEGRVGLSRRNYWQTPLMAVLKMLIRLSPVR